MQWLSVVVSVVAVAFLQPSSAAASPGRTAGDPAPAQATPHAMNLERAKMGLLPRRAARSRVRYLEAATSPRRAAMASSAFDEQPVTLVLEDVAESAVIPTAGPLVMEVPEADPAPPAAASSPAVPEQVEAADAISSEPPVASASDAPASDASEAPEAAPATEVAPPAQVAAKDPPPPAGAEDVERVIDANGDIIIRVRGPDTAVLGERVVGSLVDMPVLSSRREGDGTVVQTLEDDWGVIEVRRDPVGRFLSASPPEGRVKAD